MKDSKLQKGFSLLEIMVVITVIGGLFILGSNTLFAPQRTSTIDTTLDTLMSELSNQQNKSMNSDIGLGSSKDVYGVYFSSTGYTTFKGTTYSSSNTTNFVTTLNGNLRFSTIDLPNSQVIFATGSGALSNYSGAHRSIVLQDATGGLSKTMQFNQYGLVESVN